MDQIPESKILTALRIYESQKRATKRYHEKHPDKLNESAKRYYHRMKEDPEKYEKYLEKCRKRYVPVSQRQKQENPESESSPEN